MEKQDYFTNKLLVAMPSTVDVNFNRSVVYIEEHNQDGAIGIIINKTMDLTVANLLSHLGIPIKKSESADPTGVHRRPCISGARLCFT